MPYVVLPISAFLLVLRFSQVAVQIWKGEVDRLVASHEVEDELDEIRASHDNDGQEGTR